MFPFRLANIYTATSPDIKRTILRVLEGPVSCSFLTHMKLVDRVIAQCHENLNVVIFSDNKMIDVKLCVMVILT